MNLFYPIATEMLGLYNNMKNIKHTVTGKRVQISGTNSIVETILGRFFNYLEKNNTSNVHYSIYSLTRHTSEIYDAVMENKIHLGLTVRELHYPGIKVEKVLEVPLYLIRKNKWEISKYSEDLPLRNYLSIPWGLSVDKWISQHYNEGLPYFSTDSGIHAIYILQDDRWFFAPKSFFEIIPESFSYIYEVLEDGPMYEVFLVYRENASEEFLYLKEFLDHLRSFFSIYNEIWS